MNSFQLEIKNKVAHLAFNIPLKANALDIAAWQEMKTIFETLDGDKSVRAIILSGEGKHFCAGIDLQTLMDQQNNQEHCRALQNASLRSFILMLQECITAIERCRKPVIAAIHNGCIGGGVDIVAACDMRYCTQEGYFTIKETDLGLVADLGTMQRLPYILNPGRMAELAYTGRKVDGPEAKSIGLVNEVYDDKAAMISAVTQLAEQIASKSPVVIRGIKEMLLYQRDHTVADGLKHMATYNSAMLVSDDLMASMQAMMTKTTATYKDS